MGQDETIGIIKRDEDPFRYRQRVHQAWWRTFVLDLPAGAFKDIQVASLLEEGSNANFINGKALGMAKHFLEEWQSRKTGLLDKERFMRNLLSSQSLCLNFFGLFGERYDIWTAVLKSFVPYLQRVEKIWFEYAPDKSIAIDQSAFDVAIEFVDKNGGLCLLGLEVKYTDDFSSTAFDKATYRETYNRSARFNAPYESLVDAKFNQLFRGDLMAEVFEQEGTYKQVYTGLFCHPGDEKTKIIFDQYAELLKQKPLLITYADLTHAMRHASVDIESISRLESRYIHTWLSERLFISQRTGSTSTNKNTS